MGGLAGADFRVQWVYSTGLDTDKYLADANRRKRNFS